MQVPSVSQVWPKQPIIVIILVIVISVVVVVIVVIFVIVVLIIFVITINVSGLTKTHNHCHSSYHHDQLDLQPWTADAIPDQHHPFHNPPNCPLCHHSDLDHRHDRKHDYHHVCHFHFGRAGMRPDLVLDDYQINARLEQKNYLSVNNSS